MLCTGTDSGRPPVILLAGMPDRLQSFAALQIELSRTTRVCSYDRAGEGASPAPAGSVTLADEAALLDGMLDELGITEPVVVAGHSLGGLVAAQFAAQFPDRTAGCVLIDATPPSIVQGILELIPASATGISAAVRGEMIAVSGGQNPEKLRYDGTPLPRMGDVPLVVIPHTAAMFAAVDDTFGARIDRLWATGQQEWLEYSTRSRTVRPAAGTSHYVHREDPATVIAAIRSLLGA